MPMKSTVLVKGFAHLNQDFLLASLEDMGKLWKWLRVYSEALQLTILDHLKSWTPSPRGVTENP